MNWVGPGDGVNQAACRMLGIYTVQELAVTDRPAAESFTVAMQRARTDYGDRIDYVPTLDMYTFLGNPLSRVDCEETLVSAGPGFGPKRVLLEQNVPNPFGPTTRIRYATTHRGPVELRVFDAAGRLVVTLVDKMHGPGYHVVGWDGTDDDGRPVPAGVYFCRLTAPGEGGTLIKKMVLVK